MIAQNIHLIISVDFDPKSTGDGNNAKIEKYH